VYLLQDLKATLAQELDFVNEGRNSEKCLHDLKHLKYVYVPDVHWDKTSTVSVHIISLTLISVCMYQTFIGIKPLL